MDEPDPVVPRNSLVGAVAGLFAVGVGWLGGAVGTITGRWGTGAQRGRTGLGDQPTATRRSGGRTARHLHRLAAALRVSLIRGGDARRRGERAARNGVRLPMSVAAFQRGDDRITLVLRRDTTVVITVSGKGFGAELRRLAEIVAEQSRSLAPAPD